MVKGGHIAAICNVCNGTRSTFGLMLLGIEFELAILMDSQKVF